MYIHVPISQEEKSTFANDWQVAAFLTIFFLYDFIFAVKDTC